MDVDVCLPTLTICYTFVRKLRTQLHVVVFTPGSLSFSNSCCGMIVLEAELKLMKRTLA